MYVSFSPSSSHLQHKYFFNFQIPSAQSYFFVPPKFFSKLNQNYQSLLTVKKIKKKFKNNNQGTLIYLFAFETYERCNLEKISGHAIEEASVYNPIYITNAMYGMQCITWL